MLGRRPATPRQQPDNGTPSGFNRRALHAIISHDTTMRCGDLTDSYS